MNNVTKIDILEIEDKINIHLTYEQRVNVLNEYNRVCMDKGEDWETIITELVNKEYEKRNSSKHKRSID